jgi:hypothetical protein
MNRSYDYQAGSPRLVTNLTIRLMSKSRIDVERARLSWQLIPSVTRPSPSAEVTDLLESSPELRAGSLLSKLIYPWIRSRV